MDNDNKQYFIDDETLSPAALKRKHELETNPACRTNHMEYMPGMEQIKSDVMQKVMEHMKSYNPDDYTARDVRAALSHDTCTVEDFKALLSPAAQPFLEQMAQRAQIETQKHFGNTVYISLRFILPTTAKIIVFTAVLTATTKFAGFSFHTSKLSTK